MERVLWWIRRDFRLEDNTALTNALRDAQTVIPVFVLDPRLLENPRTKGPRLAWMIEALHSLQRDLETAGSRLIMRRGEPETELVALARETNAQGIYFNRDYSSFARRRDALVQRTFAEQGLLAKDFKDLVIHEADEVKTGGGKPYEVYSPFRKAWSALPKPESTPRPTAQQLADQLAVPSQVESRPIPTAVELGIQAHPEPVVQAGEQAASARLAQFIGKPVYSYRDTRNFPGIAGTSLLSPYLRWGMLSPRTAYHAAVDALESNDPVRRENVTTWIGELVWREFNYSVLMKNPQIVTRSYRPAYDQIQWENDPALFAAWCEGRTGYPLVDAAMRELAATGWMHNRVRMVVASFLVKDCLIDWRWGEAYFMRHLLDADTANNVGGWQWTAGTGTDAAPYFRVFNPTAQSEKFDPDGVYIRRWVPELRDVPTEFIHEPSRLGSLAQQRYNLALGTAYPLPIIDHAQQRDRVLALFSAARSADRP